MKNYFAFIDESGNSTQERFFGLGLLLIDDEIGDFYDSMKTFYDKAQDVARKNKIARIVDLQKQNEIAQISDIAKSSRRFELKFKYINSTNNTIYRALINKYLTFPNVRFCALVIDRQRGKKNQWVPPFNPWEIYIQQTAMLITNNIKNIPTCNLCILADDLTRPADITKSFEKSLSDALDYRLQKSKMKNKIVGISRLESHSSLLLQIVDTLLGCVMFDYKNSVGLISKKLQSKQQIVVNEFHEKLKIDSLAVSKTYHHPNYFSVCELKAE